MSALSKLQTGLCIPHRHGGVHNQPAGAWRDCGDRRQGHLGRACGRHGRPFWQCAAPHVLLTFSVLFCLTSAIRCTHSHLLQYNVFLRWCARLAALTSDSEAHAPLQALLMRLVRQSALCSQRGGPEEGCRQDLLLCGAGGRAEGAQARCPLPVSGGSLGEALFATFHVPARDCTSGVLMSPAISFGRYACMRVERRLALNGSLPEGLLACRTDERLLHELCLRFFCPLRPFSAYTQSCATFTAAPGSKHAAVAVRHALLLQKASLQPSVMHVVLLNMHECFSHHTHDG